MYVRTYLYTVYGIYGCTAVYPIYRICVHSCVQRYIPLYTAMYAYVHAHMHILGSDIPILGCACAYIDLRTCTS